MAPPEEGDRLAEYIAQCRARQRCRRGICAPQAVPRLGPRHGPSISRCAPDARSSAALPLPAFDAVSGFGRGDVNLDRARAMAPTLGTQQSPQTEKAAQGLQPAPTQLLASAADRQRAAA